MNTPLFASLYFSFFIEQDRVAPNVASQPLAGGAEVDGHGCDRCHEPRHAHLGVFWTREAES